MCGVVRIDCVCKEVEDMKAQSTSHYNFTNILEYQDPMEVDGGGRSANLTAQQYSIPRGEERAYGMIAPILLEMHTVECRLPHK